MKKSIFVLSLLLSATLFSQNQVGINQASVDPSAVFELNSTTMGLLIPRLSATDKSNIVAPSQGLIIYETSSNANWYFNGAGWIKITSDASIQDGIGDTDSDTRVFLDFTNDNDQIRFLTGGLLRFRMNRERFDVLNNGNSVFLGDSAGFVDDKVANSNVFVGTSCGVKNIDGRRNVAVGYQTIRENVFETDNVAIGAYSFFSGTTSRRNVAIGAYSLFTNTASDVHTAIGHRAYESHNSSGGGVAIGMHSMNANFSGAFNVAIGVKALESSISSSGNVVVGHEVARNSIGSSTVCLGYQVGSSNTSSARVMIDNSSTVNSLILGDLNSDILTVNGNFHMSSDIVHMGSITDVSDKRLKKRIRPVKSSLKQLTTLNGYRYQLKRNASDKKEYGLIAQEVKEVYPSLVRGVFSGTDFIGVSYVQFIPLILESEKEQFQQIQRLDQEVTLFDRELSALEQDIATLKATLSAEASKHP